MNLELHDRIDRSVSELSRQCPELDLSGVAITLRLVILGKYIEQHANATFAPFGLQTWEFDVLAALRRQGEPYTLSAGELARSVMLTCSGMTHRLDRLEQRALVRRVPAPDDRRRVLVQLTEAGRELTDVAFARRTAAANALVGRLGTRERQQLEMTLRRLLLDLGNDADDENGSPGGAAG